MFSKFFSEATPQHWSIAPVGTRENHSGGTTHSCDVNFSIQDSSLNQPDADASIDEQQSLEKKRTGVTDTSIAMHNALTKAMSMPSFNLNIKNRQSSGLIITLILLQLLSNVILMAILLLK